MKKLRIILGCAACAAVSATAQTSIDRAFESSPRDCADVQWSEKTLQTIPSIATACQAVEQRNGRSYVKLSGEVQDVANEGKRVIVDFEDGAELAFTPSARTTLYIDGERTDFADLREGTELNFYIPEDRLQAELQPDIERAFFFVFPLDLHAPERTAAAAERAIGDRPRPGSLTPSSESSLTQLPATASPWPTIGLVGAAALALAAGLSLYRRLRGKEKC